MLSDLWQVVGEQGKRGPRQGPREPRSSPPQVCPTSLSVSKVMPRVLWSFHCLLAGVSSPSSVSTAQGGFLGDALLSSQAGKFIPTGQEEQLPVLSRPAEGRGTSSRQALAAWGLRIISGAVPRSLDADLTPQLHTITASSHYQHHHFLRRW